MNFLEFASGMHYFMQKEKERKEAEERERNKILNMTYNGTNDEENEDNTDDMFPFLPKF